MIELFTATRTQAGLDPVPTRTWAYAAVGAIQVVATMWLRDEFGELDQVARDLARLMWSGLSDPGDTPPRIRASDRSLPSTAREGFVS